MAGDIALIWELSPTLCIENDLSTSIGMPAMDHSSSNSDSIFTFLKLGDSSPPLTSVQLLSQAAINSLINTSVFLFFRSTCLSTALVPFYITFQSQVLCTLIKGLRILLTTFNESFQEFADFTWIYLLMTACWMEYGLP